MTKSDKSGQRLTAKQHKAIELLLSGSNDRQVAQSIKVARQTVTEWRNHNPEFMAEINLRRQEIWVGQAERLRGLLDKAVDVLEENLAANEGRLQQSAAMYLLKCAGLYDGGLKPEGIIDPDEIRSEQQWKIFRQAALSPYTLPATGGGLLEGDLE